jgi:hypothetical protein
MVTCKYLLYLIHLILNNQTSSYEIIILTIMIFRARFDPVSWTDTLYYGVKIKCNHNNNIASLPVHTKNQYISCPK